VPGGCALQEVTISYSGPQGYTNQRFMAQYGFVPAGGNMADRLDLGATSAGGNAAPGGSGAGGGIRLALMQELVGDVAMMEAAKGRRPHLFAALKSLPLADEEGGLGTSSSGGGGGGGGDGSSQPPAVAATEAERSLARQLLVGLEVAASGCWGGLQEGEALLQRLEQQQQQQQPPQGQGEASSAAEEGADVRLLAAVRYRVERQRLVEACRQLLQQVAAG